MIDAGRLEINLIPHTPSSGMKWDFGRFLIEFIKTSTYFNVAHLEMSDTETNYQLMRQLDHIIT